MRKNGKMPNQTDTLLMIKVIYPSLTKTEKKVADLILQHSDSAMMATITNLAEQAGVGETTILRFCRKLGFKGYQDFKLSIAIDLVNLPTHINDEIDEDDDYQMVARKTTANNERMVQDTLGTINMIELKKAVKTLIGARKIYVYGLVSSGTTAQDVYYRLMRIGMNAEAQRDAHIIAMTAALAGEQDVVFGISTSGGTVDMVEAFRRAKKNGATTIALTGNGESALAAVSDITLLVPSKEMPLQGGSFSTKIAQMNLLDVLLTLVTMELKDTAYDSIKLTAKAVVDRMV